MTEAELRKLLMMDSDPEDIIEEANRWLADSDHYPVRVQPDQAGAWKIVKTEVNPVQAGIKAMQNLRFGMPEMAASPGEYMVLVGPMGVMMSNTQMEYRTNVKIVEAAHGDVLIAGLGIGMILEPMLQNPKVTSITVLEREQDVFDMVAGHFSEELASGKLRIVMADVFTWEPDRRYDFVYHDIWHEISDCNLKEFDTLREKYAPFAGEQHFWAEELCQRMGDMTDTITAIQVGLKV